MASLDKLLNRMGLTKQVLEMPVNDEVCKMISLKLDHNWECLATSIGVANDIIHDINRSDAENLPLALLTRWKELYGSEATYCRLINGLDEIGRRDLTEMVLVYSKKAPILFIERLKFTSPCIFLLCVIPIILVLLIFSIIFVKLFFTVFQVVEYTSIPVDAYLDNNTCFDCHDLLHKRVAPNDQNSSHCATGYSNLPNIQSNIFIGREKDVAEIARMIQSTHIVNVNGPPGFGKSSAVIHAGYKLVQNGTPVRYLDVEQELPQIFIESVHDHDPQNNSSKYRRRFFNKNSTAILEIVRSVTDHERDTYVKSRVVKVSNTVEELIQWSKEVQCFTVLILDNCDDVLSSNIRGDFVDLINFLVQNSNNSIHIIVVAQAKLLLLDNFAQWTVRELTTENSVKLLQKLAPGVPSSQAELISSLVERCPLALKVVGSLLHLNGGDTLTKMLEAELKHNPIGVLDQADHREHQFRIIMELAMLRFSEVMDNECDYSISLFPSTFTWETGHSVLLHQGACLNSFVKYSLLDEYLHGYLYRYRMHRLIKEYLLEKVTPAEVQLFKERFSIYFESFILQYIEGGMHQLNEIEEYTLNLETQNIQYYLDILISQESDLTHKQLAILSYGFTENLVSLTSLKSHFAALIKGMTDVCTFVDTDLDMCGKLYSEIIQHFYAECTCRNLSQYLVHLRNRHCPCTSSVNSSWQCETVFAINNTETIWVLLPAHIQQYIERIMLYNCHHSHVYTFHMFSTLALLILSLSLKLNLSRRILITFMLYVIISVLYAVYKVSGETELVVIVEIFLKVMCLRLIFLLLLLGLLFYSRNLTTAFVPIVSLFSTLCGCICEVVLLLH